MSSADDSEYFRDRKRASIVMSLSASESAIRKIHLELADKYAVLADDPIRGAKAVSTSTGKTPIGDTKQADSHFEASAIGKSGGGANDDVAYQRAEPSDVEAIAGNVTIAAAANRITSRTFGAAASTADRLTARGHDAVGKVPATPTASWPAKNADWSTDVMTQGGYAFRIRQASNADHAATSAFAADFDPERTQSSILSDLRHTKDRHKLGGQDGDADPPRIYLAIETDSDRIIATAAAVRDPNRPTVWAVLIIRPEFREGGIRSRLLDHLAALAFGGGISTLIAIEEHSSPDLPDTDQQAGWVTSRYVPDPRFIVLSKTIPSS